MDGDDLAVVHLDVHDSEEGVWHPEHGVIDRPLGWDFLPSGDAFVTRRVKAAGMYWSLWRPRGRNRPHRRPLGIVAPVGDDRVRPGRGGHQRRATIDATSARGGLPRPPKERYRQQLAKAIVAFLDFAPSTTIWLDPLPPRRPSGPPRSAAAGSVAPARWS